MWGRVKPQWVPSAGAPLAPYLAGVERVAGARARVVSIVVRGPQTCKRRRHHAQEQAHVTHDNARGQTRTFREKLWTTLATTAPSATRRRPARNGTSNATATIAYTQQRRRVRQLQRHGLRAGASYTNAVTKHHRNIVCACSRQSVDKQPPTPTARQRVPHRRHDTPLHINMQSTGANVRGTGGATKMPPLAQRQHGTSRSTHRAG